MQKLMNFIYKFIFFYYKSPQNLFVEYNLTGENMWYIEKENLNFKLE